MDKHFRKTVASDSPLSSIPGDENVDEAGSSSHSASKSQSRRSSTATATQIKGSAADIKAASKAHTAHLSGLLGVTKEETSTTFRSAEDKRRVVTDSFAILIRALRDAIVHNAPPKSGTAERRKFDDEKAKRYLAFNFATRGQEFHSHRELFPEEYEGKPVDTKKHGMGAASSKKVLAADKAKLDAEKQRKADGLKDTAEYIRYAKARFPQASKLEEMTRAELLGYVIAAALMNGGEEVAKDIMNLASLTEKMQAELDAMEEEKQEFSSQRDRLQDAIRAAEVRAKGIDENAEKVAKLEDELSRIRPLAGRTESAERAKETSEAANAELRRTEAANKKTIEEQRQRILQLERDIRERPKSAAVSTERVIAYTVFEEVDRKAKAFESENALLRKRLDELQARESESARLKDVHSTNAALQQQLAEVTAARDKFKEERDVVVMEKEENKRQLDLALARIAVLERELRDEKQKSDALEVRLRLLRAELDEIERKTASEAREHLSAVAKLEKAVATKTDGVRKMEERTQQERLAKEKAELELGRLRLELDTARQQMQEKLQLLLQRIIDLSEENKGIAEEHKRAFDKFAVRPAPLLMHDEGVQTTEFADAEVQTGKKKSRSVFTDAADYVPGVEEGGGLEGEFEEAAAAGPEKGSAANPLDDTAEEVEVVEDIDDGEGYKHAHHGADDEHSRVLRNLRSIDFGVLLINAASAMFEKQNKANPGLKKSEITPGQENFTFKGVVNALSKACGLETVRALAESDTNAMQHFEASFQEEAQRVNLFSGGDPMLLVDLFKENAAFRDKFGAWMLGKAGQVEQDAIKVHRANPTQSPYEARRKISPAPRIHPMQSERLVEQVRGIVGRFG